MDKDKPNNRITVIVDDELFQKIEDYRFEKRFQTRKEAINDLLNKGIEALLAQEGLSEGKEEK